MPSANDVHSEILAVQNKVIAFVDSKVMGNILPRTFTDYKDGFNQIDPEDMNRQSLLESEKCDSFRPDIGHFHDLKDPRRGEFNKELNYNMPVDVNDENLYCVSTFDELITQYRNIQLATNIHFCTFTCFKYSKNECRFSYPKPISNSTTIVHDRDRKQRARTRVLPSNNNAYFNPHIKSPLYVCAQRCNTDIQYIGNKRGAAEYCTSYALKAEEPDRDSLSKFLIKFYNNKQLEGTSLTLKDHYKAVGLSLLHATPITTVQACWFLLGLPFVYKSRTIISVNTSPIQLLSSVLITNEVILRNMNPNDSIVCKGPNTQIGRRGCYTALAKQQYENYNICHITLFVYVTNLKCEIYNANNKTHCQLPIAPLLVLQDNSCILDLKIKSFRIGELYVYKLYKVPVVVKVSPYKRLDPNDELCCYSILLLHKPFTNEDNILSVDSTTNMKISAIAELKKSENEFPTYVKNILESIFHSQTMLDNQGTITMNDKELNSDNDSSDSESIDEDVDYDANAHIINTDMNDNIEESINNVNCAECIQSGISHMLNLLKMIIVLM
jgi:hypothetical protein